MGDSKKVVTFSEVSIKSDELLRSFEYYGCRELRFPCCYNSIIGRLTNKESFLIVKYNNVLTDNVIRLFEKMEEIGIILDFKVLSDNKISFVYNSIKPFIFIKFIVNIIRYYENGIEDYIVNFFQEDIIYNDFYDVDDTLSFDEGEEDTVLTRLMVGVLEMKFIIDILNGVNFMEKYFNVDSGGISMYFYKYNFNSKINLDDVKDVLKKYILEQYINIAIENINSSFFIKRSEEW